MLVTIQNPTTNPPEAVAVTPEKLLLEVLIGIQDNSYSEKLKGIPIERLASYVENYYNIYRKDKTRSHNLELAKAFANLIDLLDPDYQDEGFSKTLDAVTHAWLKFIPQTIKAARPMESVPGEIIERLSISSEQPLKEHNVPEDSPYSSTTAFKIDNRYVDFDEEELKNAKHNYTIAEFGFLLRDFQTTQLYLEKVLKTSYLNVNALNLMVQNSILWSEKCITQNEFQKALDILNRLKKENLDLNSTNLINDKINEAKILEKITDLENKCPLNERLVGPFLRDKVGYKKFLKLTYYIFSNTEFHERLEKVRTYPKNKIYPLLSRKSTQKTEELIMKRHEMHDKLIRELYIWFWELDLVKKILSLTLKHELTVKFGEYGSGPVIYFRYISKGQYANIVVSKAIDLAGQGKILEAKKELFQTYELTGSKKIKGYLQYLRRLEKAKKLVKSKSNKKARKNIKVISKEEYANKVVSKAIDLAGEGKIQEAKRELFQTYKLTESKNIKGCLHYLRRLEKAKKVAKSKSNKKARKNIKVVRN